MARSLRAMGANRRRRGEGRRARSDGLARLFGGEVPGRQAQAAAAAVTRRWSVVAGGPGTGKTTTVARIVALICEQAAAVGRAAPLVALAAPTGKAAARLQESVHAEAAALDVPPEIREQLLDAARIDHPPPAGLAPGEQQPLSPRPQPAAGP